MRIHKLASTDGFIAVDLDDAPRSSGIVRVARKILRDGATNLARERTYTYAAFGVQAGGASAGLNALPDDATEAVAALVAETADQVAAGTLDLAAGKGVPEGSVGILGGETRVDAEAVNAVAAVVGAETARGGLDGATAGIDADAPTAASLARSVEQRGATVTLAPLAELGSDHLDVVFVGSRPGALDHELAAGLDTDLIVPVAPLAVTAKALAVATRSGAVVLPGFVTAAGEVLARELAAGTDDPEAAVAARVAEVVGRALESDEGAFLGACHGAEKFLATWTDERPFGRPLA